MNHFYSFGIVRMKSWLLKLAFMNSLMFHPAGFILTSLSFGLFSPLYWNVSKSLETAFYFAHFFFLLGVSQGFLNKCGCFLLFLFVSQCVAYERDLEALPQELKSESEATSCTTTAAYLRFKCKRANQEKISCLLQRARVPTYCPEPTTCSLPAHLQAIA